MGSERPRQTGLTRGVLELVFGDLASQIDNVRPDVLAAKEQPVHTAAVILLDSDPGWRELPRLFDLLFELPISALRVIVGAVPASERSLFATPLRGDHVARALGRRQRPARLEELWITAPGLSAAGLERIAGFNGGLKRLGLRDNSLSDAALRSLVAADCAALELLALGGNRPTSRGIRAIATARLPALSRIGLWNCQLGVASVSRLVEGSLGALTWLSLSSNPLGDDGIQVLAESEFAERLERLELAACGIGDAGAKHLANSPSLRGVGLLDLRRNEFGERGQKLLLDRFGERALVRG